MQYSVMSNPFRMPIFPTPARCFTCSGFVLFSTAVQLGIPYAAVEQHYGPGLK